MVYKFLWALFWSGVKYLIGVASCMAIFSNPAMGFLVSTAGAFLGILSFTFGGWWIEQKLKTWFFTKGRHFNKRTRLLIRLKHNGGLPLIAILTPVFLSFPVGCILATTFVHSRWKIVFYMAGAAFVWGMVIFGCQWVFDIDLAKLLRTW